MGTSNYSDEFKRDAVQQIPVQGYPVREVARRLGVSSHSLYKWLKLFGEPVAEAGAGAADRGARHSKEGEPWIATGSRAMANAYFAQDAK